MKIAIFSDTFPPQVNGVANVAYISAVELGKLGHEVHVFTISNGLRRNNNAINKDGRKYFSLVRLPALPAFAYPEHRFALPLGIAVNKLRKIKPDIIHTHTPFSVGWEAILSAKIFKIPIIGTHHTFYDHYLKHVKLDYRWAKKPSWKYMAGYYNFCDLILSPTDSLAGELKNHGMNKPTEILANSIDTNFFKPVSNPAEQKQIKNSFGINGKSLVYMGRVSYEKSIDQVIKAVSLVAKEIPDIKLVVVGDGPERTRLEKLAGHLRIRNNVLFTGMKHNQELVKTLQANDVFLTASKSENMPLSVLEAMATGLPVIAADALGIPEIVKDNVNGFLTPPEQPEIMAEKITELINNDDLLKKFSEASRKLSLNHSREYIAKLLEKTYKKLIK